ncbi:hypothetical protein N7533_007374 [Penicillium manginii]|uniref:uncharacterized protein n=1 Tax=Penicillium manginii TaxID=203109 RepID=UPI002548BD41|nr:uncharacterized protein N7533_007374 [Penicillium manginii]KAJ5750346.1 hypothetical protein N7533_007374 [Penicillium manginii]
MISSVFIFEIALDHVHQVGEARHGAQKIFGFNVVVLMHHLHKLHPSSRIHLKGVLEWSFTRPARKKRATWGITNGKKFDTVEERN